MTDKQRKGTAQAARSMRRRLGEYEQTRQAVRSLVEQLAAAGARGFCPTATVSRGAKIGHAIFSVLGVNDCVDIAIEVLEQWNGHLSVAAINAIEKGRGQVERKGRVMTITLPEHWEKI